jgi:hypothetical protein
VPLISAALSGTEDQRTFAPERHARLQSLGSMLAHLNGVLSALNQVRVDDLRSVATSWLSFAAEDVYLPDEPCSFTLGARSAVEESLLRHVPAELVVTDRATGAQVVRRRMQIPRESQAVEVGVLPPGTYTVRVSSDVLAHGANLAPVSDVFVVPHPADLA